MNLLAIIGGSGFTRMPELRIERREVVGREKSTCF